MLRQKSQQKMHARVQLSNMSSYNSDIDTYDPNTAASRSLRNTDGYSDVWARSLSLIR